ncbi:hypothetical protein BpHYR1_050866 [Brachionus plicatilis]|uniref:Uncharacterized protein n=1 Tax=Brachionus plicatilis TaxID=10195 RepID=A0A3M7QWN9_BRAPC|nr:hypothetical protein BpHYR1_050866 [Brachionus plicatilis]
MEKNLVLLNKKKIYLATISKITDSDLIIGSIFTQKVILCKNTFCEVQYKRTEQRFEINSVNAEWCNIQSCIQSCNSLVYKGRALGNSGFLNLGISILNQG